MTIEIILLGLVCAIRPTSLAALYALLSTPSPRRLMIIYVVAGLAFTVAFGGVVIWAFGAVDINSGSGRTKGIAEIAGGIVALTFGFCVLFGLIGGAHPTDAPKASGRWGAVLKRELTPRTTAVAGPLTHIPGVFYFIALNVIVAYKQRFSGRAIEVVIYNLVWFALPLAALVLCIVKPQVARDGIGATEAWTKRHARAIMLVVSFGAAAGLIVRGAMKV
ncbi:MAG: GAP family protein [Solirubrobacteraceae bacterium]